LDDAERFLRESTKNFADFAAKNDVYWGCPYQALGELYAYRGDGERLIDNLKKAVQVDKNKTDSALAVVKACRSLGRYDCALEYLNLASRSEPDARQADEIVDLIAQNRRLQAAEDLPRGTPPAQPSAQAHTLAGFAQLLELRYDDAGRHFAAAAELDTGAPGHTIGLGHLATIEHDFSKAKDLL
jgi:tetratricopeptide (TPR) repeat protein